ncbi:MAG TPA: hypothetical protein VLT61_05615 [Anaeromyxobacteraceae bacterium]|nr:hypothetical protein [Anaeromyxobacteraceae bacterium]
MEPIPPTPPAPPEPPAPSRVTLGLLLARAFQVWGRNLLAFAGVGLAFHVPVLLATWALGSPFVVGRSRLGTVTPEQQAFIGSGRYGALVAVSLIFALLQMGALTAGALSHLSGRRASVGEMILSALRRLGPLLVSNALAAVAILLGFLLLVVPGVVVTLMLLLIVPVAMAEPLPIKAMFGRSRALTKGHRWKLLGLTAVAYVVSGAPAIAVALFPVQVPYLATGLGLLINVLPGTFILSVPAVAYHELRAAAEGAPIAALERVFE